MALHLGDGVAGFEAAPGGKGLVVKTQAGKAHAADLVMLVGSGGRSGGMLVCGPGVHSGVNTWVKTWAIPLPV